MQTRDDAAHRPELIFALVGGAGVRLEDLSNALKDRLTNFGYEAVEIRLSALLKNFKDWKEPEGKGEFERIRNLQNMGNALRRRLEDGAALARAGLAQIRAERSAITEKPDRPASSRAYIIHQLKNPDEADMLRRVYGSSFVMVAGHAPHSLRAGELVRRMAGGPVKPGQESHFMSKALEVIANDEKQDDDLGQNTRDTYPKADFFANLGVSSGHIAIHRFVDLLFGHPFHTPKPDEYAMYQASAVSLRSSDDNRQVGAAIVSRTVNASGYVKNIDVIAVGMNEVPRGGGGFYWDEDSPDNRDQALLQQNKNPAREIKISALAELIEKIRQRNWLQTEFAGMTADDLAKLLLQDIGRTQFMDMGEFSRPVHAEMATLIDAARRGVAVDGHSMYVTTFPCHNCAKHIIAAGLRRVVYLEPYPKSRARDLYEEEIDWETKDGKEVEDKVVFWPFSGIAPRQYGQLFSVSERSAKKGGSLRDWHAKRHSLSPRYVPLGASIAHLAAERQELEKLPTDIYEWDKESICPPLVTRHRRSSQSRKEGSSQKGDFANHKPK